MDKQRLAIIRIRGQVGVRPNINKTLNLLKLYRKNYCTILSNTPESKGMINLVKDYVTFGEINKETFLKLLQERGRIAGNKLLTEKYIQEQIKQNFEQFINDFFEFKKDVKDIPGAKSFFRLKPPTGGFERKGITKDFAVGGALGYRGDKINKLIERML